MRVFVFIMFISFQVFGQNIVSSDSLQKTNPVLFYEFYCGIGGSTKGLMFFAGGNLNYEFLEKNLVTFRYTGFGSFKRENLIVGFSAFPLFIRKESVIEYALLYGKRYVYDGKSLSFSAGISVNDRVYYNYSEEQNNYNKIEDVNLGLPVELNIKWFKAKKKRFRAYYGIIPIGKRKVSFGRSVGFKLIGNFSKTTYVGFGFTYGLGWHKQYKK